MKAFARGLGLEPEKVLTQAALSEPDTKYLDPQERDHAKVRTLSIAIKDLIKKELVSAQHSSVSSC